MEGTKKAGAFQRIFDAHFDNLLGLWRLTMYLKWAFKQKPAACGDEEAIFYFVMNRAVNFVGCTFKVI